MGHPLLHFVLIAALLVNVACWAAPLGAQVTAVLTADNHYALYHAAPDGSGWTFIGRNEMGQEGNPGPYNWSLPETYIIDVPEDDQIYVVAWDEDGAGLSMWIGSFSLPDGRRVVTDLADWEYICGSGASPRWGDAPPDDVLVSDVSSGTFAPPRWSVPNGSGPWSSPDALLPDVGADANFIWDDDSGAGLGCGDHYIIFRTVNTVRAWTASAAPRRFIRGDTNADGMVDLTDVVAILGWLYLGGTAPSCMDAADFDDSGLIDLTDAIATLGYLYLGHAEPPVPGALQCGAGAVDDPLSCDSFPACP